MLYCLPIYKGGESRNVSNQVGLSNDHITSVWGGATHLRQTLRHNLGAVVDGENDISDSCLGQGLDLVHNHGLVAKLNEGLGRSEGLHKAQKKLDVSDCVLGVLCGSVV